MLKKLTTLLFLLLVAVNTRAAIDSSWLVNQQNSDGSFIAANDIAYPSQSTSEVLQTLYILDEVNLVDENQALQVIESLDLNHLENLVRKISLYKNANKDISALVVQLKLFANADGGFGSSIGYQSTILDTALAMQALAVSGYLLDDNFAYALAYLTDRQNMDGSWSSAGNVSSVFITATVSLALQEAQAVFDVTDKIATANIFLLDYMQNNIADIEVFEIASAVLSVAPTTSDKTSYQFLLDHLLITRDADGSWVQDTYTTALALRALFIAEQVVPVSEDLSSVVNPGSSISAVTGVVIDNLSAQVLAGVMVNIATADGSNVSAITDVNGRYTISSLFPGAATVSVDLAGYHPVTATPVLSAGVIHRFNPVLARQPQLLPVNITGSVVDVTTGLPLSGVSVQIMNSSVGALTGITGDFSLNNLSPGSISMQVSRAGYISRSYVISVASGGVVNLGLIALTPGSMSNNLSTLTGIITDAISGLPLNGVAISLSGADNQSAFSDVSGLFTINNVNSGESNITAVLAGHNNAVSSIRVAAGENAQFNAVLVKSENQAQVTIQGKVIDNETLLPLPGVKIQLIGQSPLVQTNSAGEFQLAGLTPGVLNVVISLADYQNISYNIIVSKGGFVDLGQIRLSTKTSTSVPGTVVTINVPGISNMWLAGMPGGTTSGGDSSPVHSPVLVNGIDFTAGFLTFSNVTGGVNNEPGCLPDTGSGCSIPDGSAFYNHFPGAINGMSNVRAPINALMGVFLDDSQPDSSPAPATLNFETTGTGFVSLSPELRQMFFIGDGLTGSGNGEVQKFVIPQGATRLYLGVMDGYGWYNNSGSMNVGIVVKSGELDLAATALNVDKVSTNLQTLQISGSAVVNIKNIGIAPVETPTLVTVFEDSNANKLYDIGVDKILGETTVFVGLAKDDALDVDVPLSGAIAFRDSPIYVMVDSDLQIVESNESNNVSNTMELCRIPANAPGQTAVLFADVTISSLELNGGTGLASSVSVRVGNGGELSIEQPVNISFYEGDPDIDGLLLGTVTISGLASGIYQDVTLNNISALAGDKDIVAVADANDSVTECNELNNTVRLPVFAGSSSAELIVSTDNMQYITGSPVLLQGVVSNTSAVPGQFIVQLQVEDAQGNIIHTFTRQNTGLLAGQATININNIWNSAGILTGSYQLRGQLFDLNNTILSSSTTSFDLVSAAAQPPGLPPGQSITALRSNTDKSVYHTNDSVRIDNLISNNSTDSIITDARLGIDIRNTSNISVFTQTVLMPTLTAGARLQKSIVYSFTGIEDGNYIVNAQLLSQQNAVLSSAQTSYIVKSDVIKNLAAQTSVQSASLYIGQAQVCTDSLQNTGTLDLTSLAIQQTLIDVSANQILKTQNQTIDLVTGASQTLIRNIDTATLAAGDYICAIQVNVDGNVRTLDFAAFKMSVPPVSAIGDVLLGSRGQLLVWFETHPDVDDEQHDDEEGDDHEAHNHADQDSDVDNTQTSNMQIAQRQYLENLLDEAGWVYTLVDNQSDFATAFSSGQYQAYILLNRKEKLDKLLAKSLREAIYRGEGLMLIADNNNEESELRNSLQETFGIDVRESMTAANNFIFVSNNPLNLNGSIAFDDNKPVQKLMLKQAQAVLEYEQQASSDDSHDSDNGNYEEGHEGEHNDDDESVPDSHQSESGSNNTAVSFNQYGQGRALYAGLDVLAYAQQYQDKTLLQDLIKQALLKTHPATLAQSSYAVMPIEVTVQNTGSDAIVQANLNAPVTSSWLRAIDGVISAPAINWQYPALAGSERELTAWLQLPASGGDIDITLLTRAGLNETNLIDQNTATQMISVTTPVTLNSIVTRIEDLQTQGYTQKALKKALKKLNKALEYESEDKLSQASEEVIKATDKLKEETAPAIIDVRLQIDAWLRLALLRSQGALFFNDDDE